jgi:hypothetical protein
LGFRYLLTPDALKKLIVVVIRVIFDLLSAFAFGDVPRLGTHQPRLTTQGAGMSRF